MIFRIPRPWVLDPNFPIVESARAEATGFSFPSGHTQCATNLYGGIARSSKSRSVQIGGALICLAVAFSRMYLGVHTPKDVLVSLFISTALVLLYYPLIYKAFETPKRMYFLIGTTVLLALANLLFVSLYQFPQNVDAVNLADGQKVAWQLFFITLALCIVYPIDHHLIKFPTDAVWWAQILKLVGGVAIVLAVRIFLKEPFNALFGVNVGSGLRYFVLVLAAGLLWPMTFARFARLGKKKD
jgi:undecaprenyl-diphosphatase